MEKDTASVALAVGVDGAALAELSGDAVSRSVVAPAPAKIVDAVVVARAPEPSA